jgi:hypothetical protein
MMSQARALISWVPSEKGGRQAPPSGPQYICPVHLRAQSGRGTEGEWSLVVEFERSFGNGFFTYAGVRFLAPEAPHDLLADGARFELHEGRRLVAIGIITADGTVPADVTEFEAVLLH